MTSFAIYHMAEASGQAGQATAYHTGDGRLCAPEIIICFIVPYKEPVLLK